MAKKVSKSQFKARALQYIREVQMSGRELIVTDRGRPVITVAPYRSGVDKLLRPLRGSVLSYKNPTEPIGTKDWEILG